MDNERNKDKEEKRGIFLGIIGVLTLIVAIIGASFAYFSINARSQQDAVNVQAATVQVNYHQSKAIVANDLIPSERSIALDMSNKTSDTCKDVAGRTVCSVYDFDITYEVLGNSVDPADITFSFKVLQTPVEETEELEESEEEEEIEVPYFKNLKYILYDVTDTDDVKAVNDSTGSLLSIWNDEQDKYNDITLTGLSFDGVDIDTESVPGKNVLKKNYRLFVWLDETNDSQDDEQGAKFSGTIEIDFGANGRITGRDA